MNRKIILSEILIKAVRSSGKGGQHVNKVSTRIELYFQPGMSEGLSEPEKALIEQNLAAKISSDGILRITCDQSRSQARNKEIAIAKLMALLEDALREKKQRKKTRIPEGAKRRRLEEKAKRAKLKSERRNTEW